MMASMSPDRSTPGDDGIRASSRQRPGARQDPRLDWWRDARFGLFFHWGLYSLAAGQWRGAPVPGIGEWIMHHGRIPVADYAALASRFEGAEFDAAAWVAWPAVPAPYVVFTPSNHDGYCMYDSALTDYTIVRATPFGRDPLAELAASAPRQVGAAVRLYSQTRDWHHPDGGRQRLGLWILPGRISLSYVEHYVKPVAGAADHYGPLAWCGSTRGADHPAQSRGLLDLVHSLQPIAWWSGGWATTWADYASARDHRVPRRRWTWTGRRPPPSTNLGLRSDDHNWRSGPELIRELGPGGHRRRQLSPQRGPHGVRRHSRPCPGATG
jgi:alpha-L-fucosidase